MDLRCLGLAIALNLFSFTLWAQSNTFILQGPAQILLSGLSGDPLNEALIASSPVRNAVPTFIEDITGFAFSTLLESHFSGIHTDHVMKQLKRNVCCDCEQVCACETQKSDFWIDGFADFAVQKAQNQTPTCNFNTEGIFLGYDYQCLTNGLVGIAAGYANSNYHEKHHRGGGNINYFVVTPYGTAYLQDAYVEASLTFSYNRVKNRRHIEFTGFDETASSSYNSYLLMPHFGIGYDMVYCCGVFEPFVALDLALNGNNGYTEHGSDVFDVKQKCSYTAMLRSEMGIKYYQAWEWGCENIIFLRETVAYVNKTPFHVGKVKSALVGNPNDFTLQTFKASQNLITLGICGTVKSQNGYYGTMSFDGEYGSSFTSYDIQLEFGRIF